MFDSLIGFEITIGGSWCIHSCLTTSFSFDHRGQRQSHSYSPSQALQIQKHLQASPDRQPCFCVTCNYLQEKPKRSQRDAEQTKEKPLRMRERKPKRSPTMYSDSTIGCTDSIVKTQVTQSNSKSLWTILLKFSEMIDTIKLV